MKPIDQVLETSAKMSSMEIQGAWRIAATSLRDFPIAAEAKSLDDFNNSKKQIKLLEANG
jgi:translation initiation factor 2B subunit (eIF-2B alpha/beta/delta family)